MYFYDKKSSSTRLLEVKNAQNDRKPWYVKSTLFTLRPIFLSVSLYDQLFLRYKIVENQKSAK